MKPEGKITQLGVTGSISQLGVTGMISQLSVTGSIAESGYVHEPVTAPTLLVATASAFDQIDLVWQDNSDNETGFSIERSLDGVTYAELDTVLANVENYSDTTCDEATEYFYRIRGYRDAVYSDYSNTDSDTTPSEVTYDADLLTYISGLVTPLSEGQLTLLNTFITSLKTGLGITNLSDAFDIMYILAGETQESSLRNFVKRAHDGTAVNSPTFTALEGFAGDGLTSYLNSNYNPTTHRVNYSQNSASVGIYKRAGTSLIAGTNNFINNSNNVLIQSTGSYVKINRFSWWVATGGSDLNGIHILTRTASNNENYYQNGTKYSVTANSLTGVPNLNLFIGAADSGAGAISFSVGQASLFFAGKLVTDANESVIRTAFEAYMDANGRGVI